MIRVTIYKNGQGVYTGFKSAGHAGYAPEGSDIICSAVSVLVINTINSIEAFTDDRFSLKSDEQAGLIEVDFNSGLSHDTILLMNAMVQGLKMIQADYNNDYIYLKIEEV